MDIIESLKEQLALAHERIETEVAKNAELEKENSLLKRVEEIFNASPDLTFDCCKKLFTEDFQAHNLGVSAKALNEYAYSNNPLTKRGLNLESIALSDKAKALKEQVK